MRVIIVCLCAWFIAQLLKVIINSVKYLIDKKKGKATTKVTLETLFKLGGMPSSHSAVVMAACFSCGILYGFGSPLFAISAVLAVVVMRDAAGVRRESGKQAAAINQMSRELNKKKKMVDFDLLTELLGHTPLQVFFGGVLGIIMAYLCQLWLFPLIFPPM